MKFILLIRGEERWNSLSTAEAQATLQNYREWAGKLRDESRLVDAEGLTTNGRIMTSEDGVLTDGPFVETKEMVGGYYTFTAKDMGEAIEIAKQCPALSY